MKFDTGKNLIIRKYKAGPTVNEKKQQGVENKFQNRIDCNAITVCIWNRGANDCFPAFNVNQVSKTARCVVQPVVCTYTYRVGELAGLKRGSNGRDIQSFWPVRSKCSSDSMLFQLSRILCTFFKNFQFIFIVVA